MWRAQSWSFYNQSMPSFVRYNMNGDYTIFTRMKEKGISLAAFATTILFLVLTVVMVSVTLQSAYAWLVMGSTLFLFLTLCSYSSCEKTRGAQWRRASTNSDSVSTISDNVAHQGDCNRSVLPYWITDLPPSYAAATSRPEDSVSPYPPPPAYSTVVELPPPPQQPEVTTAPQPSRDPNSLFLSCGPPERIHSLRIPKSVVRSSPSKNSDALSLDGHLSERERRNSAMDDSSSTC